MKWKHHAWFWNQTILTIEGLGTNMMSSLSTIFFINIFFILPKNEIIAKFECVTPTIIKLIIILFNIIGVLWHIIYILF